MKIRMASAFASHPNRVSQPWRIRAVQLDLARQMENLDTIRDFISFAKNWGYNTLMLYVEGLIRTRSFPYRPASASYCPDDIRRIVKMADKAGLDVFPCVATLGYAEHFVGCRQLKHLEETGSWERHMFCPSNDETYRFLERYLAEVVRLFPSRNFHIGCDEVWALGACPVCRKRIQDGETKEDLLAAHILRVYRILKPSGKRVWIWDDMFENDCGGAIARLPRDIVMCAWHYESDLMDYDGFRGHFNNLRRHDTFGLYQKLGFDMVVAPWAKGIENTMAITEVARQHRVLGGMQTVWELSTVFLPGVLPNVAAAGALWSNPTQSPVKTLQETLKRLFPGVDSCTMEAIRSAIVEPFWSIQPPEYYLRGTMTMEEVRTLNSFIAGEQIIRDKLQSMAAGLERDILEELDLLLRLQILAGRQRMLLPGMVDPRVKVVDRSARQAQAAECVAEFDALAGIRARQWSKFRDGIKPDRASRYLLDLKAGLQQFIRGAARTPPSSRALLNVRLFLEDSYSAPRLKIELGVDGKWRQAYSGCFKPVNLRDSQYTLQVPLAWKGRDPDRLRFTVSGYGGQGVSYASLAFNNRRLIPHGVGDASGEASNAGALLIDDSSVCFLGSRDTVRTLNHFLENEESSVEVLLKRK